ncbi:MAG: hypothetical protein COT17_02505 [Elusimicrobia bacterium CG08_land_8_20_14_0_20_51_18]|nr:MAG: hypothetical protein COT17_02505 [Elusimicrobia bacterium CG08_land_8_20_14_0_20_51_18]
MSENRIRLFFSFLLALAAGLLFFSWRSPLSKDISYGKPFEIAILQGDSPFLVRYDSSSRIFKAFKPNKRIKLKGTNFQKAYNLLSVVYKNGADREKIYFVDASSFSLNGADYLVSFLNGWRKNPAALSGFVKKLFLLKNEGLTNLPALDLINLSIEILHLNTSNFIIEEVDIKNPELEAVEDGETGEGLEPAKTIKVEIFNASARKNMALKVTERLRARGINVLNSSTRKTQKKTEIISNGENVEKAKAVRDIMDLKNLEIYVKKSRYRVFDVTIVIGEDFDEKKIGNRE